jgi:hypothetical protein
MPVMLNSKYGTFSELYGTQDLDLETELSVYFDFNDSEIHNADGSVADFKMQYEKNSVVDDKYLSLLSKITKKNRLAILNYVKVHNSKMIGSDLEIELVVKDVNMPNGIYQILNNAPIITMEAIDDFPSSAIIDLKEKFYQGSNKGESSIFDFTINSEVFEFYLDKLLHITTNISYKNDIKFIQTLNNFNCYFIDKKLSNNISINNFNNDDVKKLWNCGIDYCNKFLSKLTIN